MKKRRRKLVIREVPGIQEEEFDLNGVAFTLKHMEHRQEKEASNWSKKTRGREKERGWGTSDEKRRNLMW